MTLSGSKRYNSYAGDTKENQKRNLDKSLVGIPR